MTNLRLHVFMGQVFQIIVAKGSQNFQDLVILTCRNCACMHWLFNSFTSFTYNVPHFCCWSMFSPWPGRGLIDSTAESASYMLTRDNHVVGVMSRCESNKSQKLIGGSGGILPPKILEFYSLPNRF